jgi:hypothetical protein
LLLSGIAHSSISLELIVLQVNRIMRSFIC